ncbi:MAG: helix-turn-helix domain-containing protein [Candidatus Izemoplasmataceae bacterium]
MNIKVNFKAGEIYDLLSLPRYVYLQKGNQSWKQFNDKLDKEVSNPSYNQMIHDFTEKLTPLYETIQMFYVDEFLSSYDFFNLLMHAYPLDAFDDVFSYLNHIKADKDLRKTLFKSLNDVNDDLESIDYKVLDDSLKLMNYLKSLPTEISYKWQLLTLFESPTNYLDTFIQLMKEITPVYETIKDNHLDKVKAVAKQLESVFQDDYQNQFRKLTKNLVDSSLLHGLQSIYISVAFPYSFMIQQTTHKEVLIWGLYMEEGFEMLKVSIDDEINHRVQIFKNLGDKTRYDVLKLIARGITSTKKIAELLHVSSATISYHINALVTANMIILSSDKNKKYDINKNALNSIWEAFMNDLEGESVKI